MGYHANELAEIEPVEARSIAKEVFLWGMHPVAIYHFRYNFAQNEKNPRYVGINRLSWDRKPQKALPRSKPRPTPPCSTALQCSICRRSLSSSPSPRSRTITGASSLSTIMRVGGT